MSCVGQFPGPTIEANWGDWFEITVNNNLDEGTSIHWHGLLQKLSPWMDGVPGISQSPVRKASTKATRDYSKTCSRLFGNYKLIACFRLLREIPSPIVSAQIFTERPGITATLQRSSPMVSTAPWSSMARMITPTMTRILVPY